MVRYRVVATIALVTSIAIMDRPDAAESASTSYRLNPATMDVGGAEISSASYVLNSSASQRATIGTSSSPGFVLQSGFWSFVGSGLVPVLLTVDDGIMPGDVDLSWSGNNSPYDVYESTDCTNVFSSFFDTTASNNYNGITPPASSLVCYSILATAPGPAPPPTIP